MSAGARRPPRPTIGNANTKSTDRALLEQLPANTFSTPAIYDLQDFGDSCWIWMEDIEDSKADWTLDDFRDIAARLGRFNGAWLTGRAAPSFDWLCHQLAQRHRARL